MMEKDYAHLDLLARKCFHTANGTNPTIQLYTVRLGIIGVGIILWMAVQSNLQTVPSRSPVCGKNGTGLNLPTVHVGLSSLSPFSHPGRQPCLPAAK